VGIEAVDDQAEEAFSDGEKKGDEAGAEFTLL